MSAKIKKICIPINDDLYAKVILSAQARDVTLAWLIRSLIRNFTTNEKRKEYQDVSNNVNDIG